MSRPNSSRRTFLTAGGAPDPVDALFRRWRASDAAACPSLFGGEAHDDDEGGRLDDITNSIECEIEASSTSITKAAALALLEVRWSHFLLSETPAAVGCLSDRPFERSEHVHEIMTAWRILECLRPHLSGFVGEVAADYLDHPHRPIRESKLFISTGEGPA